MSLPAQPLPLPKPQLHAVPTPIDELLLDLLFDDADRYVDDADRYVVTSGLNDTPT